MRPTLVVLAKAPVPGRAKTRLCPPLDHEQAATVARAALVDTLAAAAGTRAGRHVVCVEGDTDGWLPSSRFEVIAQRGDGLAQRIAAAFEDVGGPALVIGMDTPQVTPALLDGCLWRLDSPGTGAVLGPASDGGYWAIGLAEPDPRALEDIPMSRPDTGAHQRRRLSGLGLHVRDLPPLRDVDTFDDALAVARLAPGTRFAATVRGLATATGASEALLGPR